MSRTLPFVAIVVLSWNRRDLTLDCLSSLAQMDYPADRLKIIVVDNGSSDGTSTAVRESFAHVTVLENGDNLGFAEGNNVGIRLALQGPAQYVVLVNDDTVVDPKMLSSLINAAEWDPAIGVVTPKIYYYDEPTRIWCAGASIDWRCGATTRLKAEQVDDGSDETAREVDFASGCAMCWRRQAIEQVGVLDPRFFMYYEETDWCVRAHSAGWRIVYEPRARMWHRISAAMGRASPATDYYMNRNVLLFMSKHLTGLARPIVLARLGGRSLLAIAAYTVKSHGGARRRSRDARVMALRDALLDRWGRMGPDVAAICYPDRQ